MISIPFDDRGLLLGDGLFETILALDGRLVGFDSHVRRLTAGCLTLGLPAPAPGALQVAALKALATISPSPRAAVRLTWTAGSGGRGLDRPDPPQPRLIAAAAPVGAPAGPVALALSSVRRNEGSPASGLKTLAYLDSVLARREARAQGADEALMLDNQGRLACAAAANLFWLEGDGLFTPALDCGVLAGLMRQRVLDQAARSGLRAVEVKATPEVLAGAQALFVTNSLIGVRPVGRLGARAFAPNALVHALGRACAEVMGP